MVIWGIISAATAGVQNYAGLLSVRFFLGFVEAAYFVCPASLLLSPLFGAGTVMLKPVTLC